MWRHSRHQISYNKLIGRLKNVSAHKMFITVTYRIAKLCSLSTIKVHTRPKLNQDVALQKAFPNSLGNNLKVQFHLSLPSRVLCETGDF